ncbi:MAG: glutathione S-transferase [Myxococcota bacterium]
MTTLYLFAISHYCEKARWGLDYLGIDHTLRILGPGLHFVQAQERGWPSSALPVLETEAGFIQGSSAILDWAEAQGPAEGRLGAESPDDTETRRSIEKRLDERVGVHARRLYYSEAIVEYPETVLPIFTQDLDPEEAAIVESGWSGIRSRMMAMMDLGRAQADDSQGVIEAELDWLDGLVSDGRRYLLGDSFGRADLTVASLLAPLGSPAMRPRGGIPALPPRLAALSAGWEKRPIFERVRQNYREHRHPGR